jgi:anti-sigma regulatory factor (Ser/Thr protein kinase)
VNGSRSFPARPSSIREARSFTERALAGTDPETLESIVLMVSELATNAVRHAGSEFRVDIGSEDGAVRVVVADRGVGVPVMRAPTHEEPTGRGLRIIDRLSDAWGTADGTTGTEVWFVVRVGAEGDDDLDHQVGTDVPEPARLEAVPDSSDREQASAARAPLAA